MLKKIVFAIFCFGFVVLQCVFIYALSHGGREQFLDFWRDFGVTVPPYTHFVFKTLDYWWMLPLACAAAAGICLASWRRSYVVAACLLSFASTLALLWSTFAPALLISPRRINTAMPAWFWSRNRHCASASENMIKVLLKIAAGLVLSITILVIAAYVVLRRDDIAYETLEAKYEDASSRYIDLANGVCLHYRDRGSLTGQTLVLVHGQSSSADAWNVWSDRLSKDFRVIAIDLPGHGLTRAPMDYEPSLDAFADVIGELEGRLDLDGFTLVGHSMGGHVAWTFAARNPERLKALVLISSGGLRPPGGGGSLAVMSYAMGVFAPVIADLDPAFGLKMAMRASFNGAEIPASSITRAAELLRAPGHREIALRIQMSRRRESDSEHDKASLATIRAPTLILWGAADNVAPVLYADLFGRAIPHAQVITYADVGHVPQAQEAEKTADDLREFLNSISSSSNPTDARAPD